LQAGVYYAGGVFVPGQGFVIFGGGAKNLTNVQQLRSLDGQWELGPSIYEGKTDYNQCVLQVKLKFWPTIYFEN
jgi:hypothetical protein